MSARIPKGVRWPALILSVAAAALAYLGVSLWAGADGVVRAVTRIGAQGFAAMLALSLVNYALRFVRWQLYLRVLGHAQPVAPSLCIYLAGFALTTTPGKAGEALRSVFLKPRGVPVAASMAAFFSERLSDLLAVVVLVVVGLGAFPEQWLLAGAGAGLVLALSAPLMLPAPWQRTLHGGLRRRLAPEGRAGRAVQALAGVLAQARACHTPWVLLAAFGLSLVAWAAEAWAFHLVLGWLGAAQGMQFSSLVYSAGVLAGAISFLPGGLGGTEATMVGLLLWAGQSQAPAVAATLLIRLTTLWFAVLIGAVALAAVLRGERQRRVAAPHSACPA
ncbi:lysylphosphatidylglycerol synthase transmembrane domain-containing protein [Sphaerotilus montanus]|uniref:lysylphosphatidylglycerol synthase transmembrane domain-containing protein n=1 Tax=Sphaerotilus montanus TaxID=522889 RepID=UPI003FA2222C